MFPFRHIHRTIVCALSITVIKYVTCADSFSNDDYNIKRDSTEEELKASLHSRHIPVSSKAFDDNIYYRINWLSDNTEHVFSRTAEKDPDSKSTIGTQVKSGVQTVVHDDDTLWITTADQERYCCKLPTYVEQTRREEEAGLKSDKVSPYQLLKPLIVQEVCSYRLESYWTYELCHGRYIRQFHEESTVQKVRSQEYYLGKYDLAQLQITEAEFEAEVQNRQKEGKLRPTVQVEGVQVPYVEINMTGGTLCDLNNKPRFTRVLYVCNEDSKHELYSIKEIFTCEYEAIVLSPLLCRHPDLRVTTAPEININCYAVENAPSPPKSVKKFEAETILQRAESLLDRKSIIIGASEFGKEFKIDLQFKEATKRPARPKKSLPDIAYDSKMLRNFVEGDLCLHGGTGWWKYRFCYGKSVEQYHEERPGQRTTIVLGHWDKEEHIKWLDRNNKKIPRGKTPKQISHYYGKGDVCGVTGKPRQVEVRLRCQYTEGDPDSVALYLREPKDCDYILGIESPLLCHLLSTADEYGIMKHPDDIKPQDDKIVNPSKHPEL